MGPRHQLEELWLVKLKEARHRFEDAAAKSRVRSNEWHQGLTPSPDGGHAVWKARQEEGQALREYQRVLQIFNDLVLRGKVPPEE